MAKKTDLINCPECQKSISAYSLICAHCGTRILQKDFGKTPRPQDSTDPLKNKQAHPESHGWTNIIMLLLVFTAAVGIIARFQEKIFAGFQSRSVNTISLSPEDFARICQDGVAKTVYEEHQDIEKMNHALEVYAKHHGYPNKTALLQSCAKAIYK